jgi:hypothetical protein
MAFQAPKYWQRGDLTSASEFNKYANNCSHLVGVFSGYNLICSRNKTYQDVETTAWIIQHRSRYLVYLDASSQAQLVDRKDSKNVHGLAEVKTEDVFGLVDLDEIDWMVSGQLYRVRYCHYAIETDNI